MRLDASAFVRAALAASRAPVVLVDGPSGAGKSTFADAIVAAWPGVAPQLVRMDDLYPGWAGLEPASHQVVRDLLLPLRSSGVGHWRRWDWAASRVRDTRVARAGHPLVIEGCGCLTRASASLADLHVWLNAADDVRKRRALDRDRGAFDAHWDMWQRQWGRLVARESPVSLADLVFDTTAVLAAPGAAARGTVSP